MMANQHLPTADNIRKTLFRLPWTLSDNAMTWLEPTRNCNLNCDACFHHSDPKSQKSITQIEAEIKSMLELRRCDALLIAGGEPLTHPQIVEITQLVHSYRVKPVIVTNGIGLDKSLVRELKKAGLFAVTLHIDAHQERPGWTGKSESELNELRQQYAEMLQREKGLACGFNVTVFPDTLKDVPSIVKWSIDNVDKVSVLTLIPVRMLHRDDPHDYYVGTRQIDISKTPYESPRQYSNLTSIDIYYEILKVLPHYKFNAYLSGTALSESLKWVVGSHIGDGKNSYGNVGANSMEVLQNVHHLFKGSYLAYTKPKLNSKGKLMLLFSLFDAEMRKTARRYIASLVRSPGNILRPLYVQSISAVQPADVLPTGEIDHCDGCPNMTYWDGRLVSACRLEEYLIYGAPIYALPKNSTIN